MDLHPFGQIVRYIGRNGKRIAVTVVGFVVLLAGVVMMVTPGPGIVVILVGLRRRRANRKAGRRPQVRFVLPRVDRDRRNPQAGGRIPR